MDQRLFGRIVKRLHSGDELLAVALISARRSLVGAGKFWWRTL